jgi:HK97 gp10 family phage protein
MARSRRSKNRFPEIIADLPRGTDVAIAKSAIVVMQRAKARVPVESGRLRAAIHVEQTGLGEHAVVAGDRRAFYGHIVEFGGDHSAAQPFLIPALEDSRNETRRIVAEVLDSL